MIVVPPNYPHPNPSPQAGGEHSSASGLLVVPLAESYLIALILAKISSAPISLA